MKNKITFLIIFLIAGCGPASEYVKIKLDPGMLYAKSFPNLQQTLFDNGTNGGSNKDLGSGNCYQKVYAGYSESSRGGTFQIIDTRFITPTFANGSLPSSANFVNSVQPGLSEPIILNVPRNKSIRVGMMGAFFLTTNKDANEFCQQEPTLANLIPQVFPFMSESEDFIANDQDVIPLRVKIIRADETPASTNDVNQKFVRFNIISGPGYSNGYSISISFTYGEVSKGKTITVLAASTSGTGTIGGLMITLPHMYPIITNVVINNISTAGRICQKDNGSGQPRDPASGTDFQYDLVAATGSYALNGGDCALYPGDN